MGFKSGYPPPEEDNLDFCSAQQNKLTRILSGQSPNKILTSPDYTGYYMIIAYQVESLINPSTIAFISFAIW
jgi:hypothetical protein